MTKYWILTIFCSGLCQEGSGEEGSGELAMPEVVPEVLPYTEHREWCRVCKSLSPEDCARSEEFEQCWKTRSYNQKSTCSMRVEYNLLGMGNGLDYRITTGCSTVTMCANEMRQNFASYSLVKNSCFPPRLLNSKKRNTGVCTLCHRMTNHKSPNTDSGVFPAGDSTRIWTLDGGRNLVDVLNNGLHYLKSNHPYNPFAFYLYSLQNDE